MDLTKMNPQAAAHALLRIIDRCGYVIHGKVAVAYEAAELGIAHAGDVEVLRNFLSNRP